MWLVTGPYLYYNAFNIKSKMTISNNKTIYYLFFVYEKSIYKMRFIYYFVISLNREIWYYIFIANIKAFKLKAKIFKINMYLKPKSFYNGFINKGYDTMFNDYRKLLIVEMILIDHRYSDLKEIIADDYDRMCIVNHVVSTVLRKSTHEMDFQTFVNIELDRLIEENK